MWGRGVRRIAAGVVLAGAIALMLSGPALATQKNPECLSCHQAMTDWSVPAVDYSTACVKCHTPSLVGTHPYHNATGYCGAVCHPGWGESRVSAVPSILSSAGASFASPSSLEATAGLLHVIHGNARWPGVLNTSVAVNGDCRACHAPASCEACHDAPSTGHGPHSATGDATQTDVPQAYNPQLPWTGTMAYGNLAGAIESGNQCATIGCHNLPAIQTRDSKIHESHSHAPQTNAPWTDTVTAAPGAWTNYIGGTYTLGKAVYTNRVGYTLTTVFDAQYFELITDTDPYRGQGEIWIDGSLVGTFDCYSTTTKYQQVVYSSPNLTPGPHTIVVKALGTKQTAARAAWICIDGFRTYENLPPSIAPQCTNCHSTKTVVHGYTWGHEATGTAFLAGTYEGFACADCHKSMLANEHKRTSSKAASGGCSACHVDYATRTMPEVSTPPFDYGCTWNPSTGTKGCHQAANSAAPHNFSDTDHTVSGIVLAQMCVDCHGADLASIHSDTKGTRAIDTTLAANSLATDCLTCHGADKFPPTKDCTDSRCHTGSGVHTLATHPYPGKLAAHQGVETQAIAGRFQYYSDDRGGCSDGGGRYANCHDLSDLAGLHKNLAGNGCSWCHGAGKSPETDCGTCHKFGFDTTTMPLGTVIYHHLNERYLFNPLEVRSPGDDYFLQTAAQYTRSWLYEPAVPGAYVNAVGGAWDAPASGWNMTRYDYDCAVACHSNGGGTLIYDVFGGTGRVGSEYGAPVTEKIWDGQGSAGRAWWKEERYLTSTNGIGWTLGNAPILSFDANYVSDANGQYGSIGTSVRVEIATDTATGFTQWTSLTNGKVGGVPTDLNTPGGSGDQWVRLSYDLASYVATSSYQSPIYDYTAQPVWDDNLMDYVYPIIGYDTIVYATPYKIRYAIHDEGGVGVKFWMKNATVKGASGSTYVVDWQTAQSNYFTASSVSLIGSYYDGLRTYWAQRDSLVGDGTSPMWYTGSGTCGQGTATRTLEIKNPVDAYGSWDWNGYTTSLEFDECYSLEGADSAKVQYDVSIDGGSTWSGWMDLASMSTTISAAESAITDDGRANGWVHRSYNLSNLIASEYGSVRLRFLYANGSDSASWGWGLNNVTVKSSSGEVPLSVSSSADTASWNATAWSRFNQANHNWFSMALGWFPMTRSLALESVAVPASGATKLSFLTRWDFGHPQYVVDGQYSGSPDSVISATSFGNGAWVEVSTDGGSTWQALTGTVGGVTRSAIPSGTVSGEFIAPSYASMGAGYQMNGWWVPASYDLSAYAGQTVKVRFRTETEPNGTAAGSGWSIDDLSLYNTASGVLFADNMETVASQWTPDNWVYGTRAVKDMGGDAWGY